MMEQEVTTLVTASLVEAPTVLVKRTNVLAHGLRAVAIHSIHTMAIVMIDPARAPVIVLSLLRLIAIH